jgi:hypothetical protein
VTDGCSFSDFLPRPHNDWNPEDPLKSDPQLIGDWPMIASELKCRSGSSNADFSTALLGWRLLELPVVIGVCLTALPPLLLLPRSLLGI